MWTLLVALAAAIVLAGCSDGTPTRPAATNVATGPAATVAVPPVTHMAVQEAYRKLRAAHVRVAIPHAFRYGFASPPIVAAQKPVAGADVPAGSTVTLTLGRGPSARLIFTTGQTTVPDLLDMRAGEAATRLVALGLRFHIAKVPPLEPGDEAELLDNYRVIAQTVEPGTVVTGRRPSVGLYVEPIG
jgi:beta-lactam-binding protein with PASTA domain